MPLIQIFFPETTKLYLCCSSMLKNYYLLLQHLQRRGWKMMKICSNWQHGHLNSNFSLGSREYYGNIMEGLHGIVLIFYTECSCMEFWPKLVTGRICVYILYSLVYILLFFLKKASILKYSLSPSVVSPDILFLC